MKRAMLLSMLAIALVVGCSGKDGATGPAGPGTRIVYTSTEPIPTSDFFAVLVPEITISDMPMVSVYIRMEGTTIWYELPTYFENYPDFGQICFFSEGSVLFYRCRDFYYKIVIVK